MEIHSDYVGALLIAGREASREGDHLFFQVLNQEGKKAISDGIITLQAPLAKGLAGT
jgi:hypothetical protein